MSVCAIQSLLILFLLGFYPCLDTLTCHKGIMLKFDNNLAITPVEWFSLGTQKTDSREICQETLLLIDVGERSVLVGSKGSSSAGAQDSRAVTIHSQGSGVVAASYVQYCSSDLCNEANSSSVLLESLPLP
uniref:CD177 antigen-like n=2 Tax=Nannospalax galili TaxID=1026970 RepID=A0A8C6QMH5_NANGA